MARSALITGITGQDGCYLAELLLEKGYQVHGLARQAEFAADHPLGNLRERVHLHRGDLSDSPALVRVLEAAQPDELYNLAAQSSVHVSFREPLLTAEVTGLGAARLLEAVRQVNPKIRCFQAGSSEVFGGATEEPQSEGTPFRPRSPYGAAKIFAHWAAVNYRESFGLFAANGILFSHESPRRSTEFVARKTACAVARIKAGLQQELRLGNLDVGRDWGFARDYVRAMWLILQHHQADDFVIASGEKHTIREFVAAAFAHAGLDWQQHVVCDPALFRPTEPVALVGDARKAQRLLGWQPTTRFHELVALLVDAELARL